MQLEQAILRLYRLNVYFCHMFEELYPQIVMYQKLHLNVSNEK